jgi:glycosyltransferase involved in cell wall biosynthesis
MADDRGQRGGPLVVFISLGRGLGGPARSLRTVLRHLGDDTDQVLAAPTSAWANDAVHHGLVTEHVVLPDDARARRRARIRAAVVLASYVRRHRDRIVAVHANGQSELNLAALAALLTRVPVVMWAHTSRASPTAGWFGWFWRRTGGRVRWLAVSDVAATVLAETLGIDREVVEIVANPIDPSEVVGEPVPHDGIRIGYLGLAAPHKGFDLLAPIMGRVDRADVSLELFVAPPPSDLPLELRPPWDALAALEGRRTVYHRGRTTSVAQVYAELDIVLCPSRQESFGRVAAEAMLNGVPVVASDIPAHRDLVGHEDGGLLYAPDDDAAAARAIVRLADDPDLRRRLGEGGRARAERFAPDRVIPALLAAYGLPPR